MVYTSYFANWRKFPPGAVQVSISLYPPRGFKGHKFPDLQPPKELFSAYKNGRITESQYADRFREYLETQDKTLILKFLNDIGRDVVLLCYETPEKFCQRHIVAEWLGIKELI